MAETELVIELEGLRKTGELKIIALEKQLAGLLKEAKSLRELLGMIDRLPILTGTSISKFSYFCFSFI